MTANPLTLRKSVSRYCSPRQIRLRLASIIAFLLSASTPLLANWCEGVGCVIPPGSNLFGKSYAEWSAAYWQWLLSLPRNQNPELDGNSCLNAANGQSGPVWFLTQSAGSVVVRNCSVPASKALFFPIVGGDCSTLEPPPFHGANEADLRACIKGIADQVIAVSCELDGVPLANVSTHRIQSVLFEITLPSNNLPGVPAGTGLAVSDGYYVMLWPLNPGPHTIHTHAELPAFGFVQDITYHLTVELPPALLINSVGGTPVLQISGELGRQYVIEYTSQLGGSNTWTALPAVTLTNSPQLFVDTTATNTLARFYRARQVP